MDIIAELKKGVQYHQADRLERAGEIYTEILKTHPNHPEALHLLGLIAYQSGQTSNAINLMNRAIQIAPDSPVYYNNLANAHKSNGNFAEALKCYEIALKLKPDYAEAYFGMGNVYQDLDKLEQAMDCYRRALASKSDFYQACNNMGVALFESGEYQQASYYYQKAIGLQPNYYEAYTNLGNTFKALGRFKAANDCYFKALEIKPDCAEAFANLASSLQNLGRLDDALFYYRQALLIEPDYAEAYNDMGTVYRELEQFDQALNCFKKSASLKPLNAQAYSNMGIIYKDRGQLQEAISCYQKALQVDPAFTEAYYNLGNVYGKCNDLERAIECYRKTIELNAEHAYAYNLLIRHLQQICAWNQLQKRVAELQTLTQRSLAEGRRAAEMPFLTFALSDDPAYNLAVAKSWSDEITAKSLEFAKSSKASAFHSSQECRKTQALITIGYLSADFRNHATAHLMRSLFELHDRCRFKINAYSYGQNDGSDYRKKIEHDCDKFVDLHCLNQLEAAHAIHNDGVDILIELKGYTDGNRLEICAHRPAPVQVAWLGFPGTTGAGFLDYIITDRIVTPPEQAQYFSEKFVYMPYTYQVNDWHQKIAETKFQRRDFGLPEDGFVFCSFNEPYKIEPVIFDVWMQVLRRVPRSVLWLLKKDRTVEENLKIEAGLRGVAPARLIFDGKLPKDKHLARLQLADLFLDTRIVNGHTTTSDALWAGVPVLTLQGKHFASRVSASLLTAVGLAELVTLSLPEYEDLAARLASTPGALKAIKEKLGRNRLAKPLFDTARFVRDLENAYKMMWQIYLQGEAPRQIAVQSSG